MRLAAAAGTTGLAAAMINPRQFWCGFPGCRKLHKIPQLGKLGKVIDHFERVHHPGLGDIIRGTKDDKGNVATLETLKDHPRAKLSAEDCQNYQKCPGPDHFEAGLMILAEHVSDDD